MNRSTLSLEFELEIARQLTAAELDQAIKENAKREQAGDYSSCALHDLVDANELIAAAFETVFNRPADCGSDEDAELINAAWEEWRAACRNRGN